MKRLLVDLVSRALVLGGIVSVGFGAGYNFGWFWRITNGDRIDWPWYMTAMFVGFGLSLFALDYLLSLWEDKQ